MMRWNGRRSNKPEIGRGACVTIALSCLLVSGWASSAEAFWGTRGYAFISASGLAGEESSYGPSARPAFYRSLTTRQTLPDFESSAFAAHGASLALGLIWVQAVGESMSLYGRGDARSSAALYDFIEVSIPAGTYPGGVSLTVTGAFTGMIDLTGDIGTTSDVRWDAALELDSFTIDTVSERWQHTASADINDDSLSLPIDEPFSLSVEIYPPGYSAASPYVFPVRFYMGIGWPDAPSPLPVRAESAESNGADTTPGGRSDIDMLTTGAITGIEVTGPGVTWDSESGLLLLPEPGMSTMLCAAVGWLGWLGRRART